jgi:hypothetical protein
VHPARAPVDPHAEVEEVQDTCKGVVDASEWEAGC